jgi:hypothetical protein
MVRLLETDHLDDQLAALAWLRKQSGASPAQDNHRPLETV